MHIEQDEVERTCKCKNELVKKAFYSPPMARNSESYYRRTIAHRTTVINRGMCHAHYRASNELIQATHETNASLNPIL